LVDHADILGVPQFLLSSVCHEMREISQGCDVSHNRQTVAGGSMQILLLDG
jgi:hypothetical protein